MLGMKTILERVQPRDLAFVAVSAIQHSDSVDARFKFGGGGEDICLRAAERAK